ncbi:MAG: hypothetical protein VKM97_04740, partial [Cyanobacteriota bacterium]|nr:hypothetical protein [Cyanobacteriota bacterium]
MSHSPAPAALLPVTHWGHDNGQHRPGLNSRLPRLAAVLRPESRQNLQQQRIGRLDQGIDHAHAA